jgi:oxygen-independent coproporphyrinogen-3 oxidase
MAGVYISYPFCSQKCTYCNFASGVFPRELEPRYRAALLGEIKSVAWPWTPETVYLGGGTPSLLTATELAALLSVIPGRPWREATIEAAPGGITAEAAAGWRASGINRVSLGVQSFVARELARTGRKHTASVVQNEVEVMRAVGLANFNIDLIAGLPGQTAETWKESLDWIERLEAPHVSVYMLEVDEDSRLGAEILAFGKRYGASDVPGEDQIAEFYEAAVERLKRLGLERYEISNFARAGFASAHNLKYWRREPYLGFGSGAHSFDGAWRWRNAESAGEYVDRSEAGLSVLSERTEADADSERLFLGLRLAEGIPGEWAASGAARFLEEGLLERYEGRLRLTSRGILLSNEVFAEFV